jgi:hypothetical protein
LPLLFATALTADWMHRTPVHDKDAGDRGTFLGTPGQTALLHRLLAFLVSEHQKFMSSQAAMACLRTSISALARSMVPTSMMNPAD